MGGSLDAVVGGNAQVLLLLLTAFKYSCYLLLPSGNFIHVILHQDVTARDMVQAYLQVGGGGSIIGCKE